MCSFFGDKRAFVRDARLPVVAGHREPMWGVVEWGLAPGPAPPRRADYVHASDLAMQDQRNREWWERQRQAEEKKVAAAAAARFAAAAPATASAAPAAAAGSG